MYFAYKWKQEKLMHEHFQDMYNDKVGLLQTYKYLLDKKSKQTTRIQNESNKIHNVYLKLQKEVERQKKNFENNQ